MENKHFEMEKTCEYCGNTFLARKETTRFCSQRCQKRAMNLKKQNEQEDRYYEEDDFEFERERKTRANDNGDYFGVLGRLFGVQSQGSQQEQMLCSLLAVQKNQIESNQSIALLKMQLDSMSKELESLRSENGQLHTSESTLKEENERLSRENADLTAENEKLSELAEESKDKMAQLGNIAGSVLTQTLVSLLPHTKIGKLMGFETGDETEMPQVEENTSVIPLDQNASVEPVCQPV